jgi:hypothetical protein
MCTRAGNRAVGAATAQKVKKTWPWGGAFLSTHSGLRKLVGPVRAKLWIHPSWTVLSAGLAHDQKWLMQDLVCPCVPITGTTSRI